MGDGCCCSMNMVEAHLWNERSLKGKYIGLVPRLSREAKVSCFSLESIYK